MHLACHIVGSQDWRLSTLDKVLCSCRVPYLEQTLTSLAELPGLQGMAVYISQDGFDEGVAKLVENFVDSQLMPPVTKRVEHWQRDRKPLLSENQVMGTPKPCCDSDVVDWYHVLMGDPCSGTAWACLACTTLQVGPGSSVCRAQPQPCHHPGRRHADECRLPDLLHRRGSSAGGGSHTLVHIIVER